MKENSAPSLRFQQSGHRVCRLEAARAVSPACDSTGRRMRGCCRLRKRPAWAAAEDRGFALQRWCRPYRPRSEEHTSELQSHLNLVCRLLLEKKKKTIKQLQSLITKKKKYKKSK